VWVQAKTVFSFTLNAFFLLFPSALCHLPSAFFLTLVEGAPELVAEVAASSATKDLYDKKRAYRRNGIQEYIVWQVFEKTVSWFSLQDSEYVALIPDATGIIQSQVFPGLWLDVSALVTGDMPQVLAVLQKGLNSVEHQTFVQQLNNSLCDDSTG
jgi:Putative restriction endonuclease